VRLLLDTHALLWWFSDDPALPASCRKLIAQSESSSIFVSAISAWEISTKFRLGKLPSASDLVQDFGGYLDRDGFQNLPLSPDHGIRAGLLPGPLKDPFDRMLIAQAATEKLFIVSNEEVFDQYGVRRVW
jgi:PIN domain nuclease of toxin-antitoxin system